MVVWRFGSAATGIDTRTALIPGGSAGIGLAVAVAGREGAAFMVRAVTGREKRPESRSNISA